MGIDRMTGEPETGTGQASDAPQSHLPFDPAQLTKLRVTQAELARMFGVSRECVSQWVKKGVVVAGPDGRIDPHRAVSDVMKKTDPARLRAKIFKQTGDAEAQLRARVVELESQLAGTDAPTPGDASDYHRHRSDRERYAALAARRDYEKSMGTLMQADDVIHAIASAVTTLRVRLESLAAILAPQVVAAGSEDEARALIAENVEHALTECSRQFEQIAHGAAQDVRPSESPLL
jgi:hypothetical protein